MTAIAKTLIATVLTIAAIGWIADSRADYVLQLMLDDESIVTVERYPGDDDTQCQMDRYAYEVGDRRFPEYTRARAGGCISCDEFPEMCIEGI